MLFPKSYFKYSHLDLRWPGLCELLVKSKFLHYSSRNASCCVDGFIYTHTHIFHITCDISTENKIKISLSIVLLLAYNNFKFKTLIPCYIHYLRLLNEPINKKRKGGVPPWVLNNLTSGLSLGLKLCHLKSFAPSYPNTGPCVKFCHPNLRICINCTVYKLQLLHSRIKTQQYFTYALSDACLTSEDNGH